MKWLNNLFKPKKFVLSKAFVHKIPDYGIISFEGVYDRNKLLGISERINEMLEGSGKKVVLTNGKLQVFDFRKSKKKRS